jgi:hypothetical protein
MGSILMTTCKCGYESEDLLVGGGMMDFNGRLEIPYSCNNCKIVSSVNIFKNVDGELPSSSIRNKIQCKKCRRLVSYYGTISEDIFENIEDTMYLFSWEFSILKDNSHIEMMYSLQDKLYDCPKCNNTDMRFNSIGNWD